MHDFTKSLNNREKLLLCQYINEHNFNWNLISRSLSSHPLLLSRSAGFFTSESCEIAYTDLLHELEREADNTKYSRDLQSRPQLKLAKKYFKLHVDEIKESIWQHEREFKSVLQDLYNMKHNQQNSQAQTSNESSTPESSARKPATPQPPINNESQKGSAATRESPTPQESAPEQPTPNDADGKEATSEAPTQSESLHMDNTSMDPSPGEPTPNNSTPLDSNTNEPEEATPREPYSPTKEVAADTPKSPEDMQVDSKPEEVRETRRTSKRKSAAADNTNKHSSATPNETPEDSSNGSSKRRKSALDDTQKKTQKVLLLCLQDITTHKAGTIFEQPIRTNEAPGYHDVVYSPTDLTTIKRKIRDGQITTAQQFKANILLMFANSIMYNPPSSDIHQMAQEMMKSTENLITEFLVNYD